MKILRRTDTQNTVLNIEEDFMPDLGREDSLKQFEDETILNVINPLESYETMRYIHEPYTGLTSQCDIWFYFYFYNNLDPQTHIGGLDYSLVGITDRENALMLKQSTKSFFRLEFFNIKEGEIPERSNRKLAFAKSLTLPLGEKIFKEDISDNIYIPIFVGTNYRNKENMYLFWFQDNSAVSGTIASGNTFYMTARFFNADDGIIYNFANNSKLTTDAIIESEDLYYLVEIDKTKYSYKIFEYNGSKGNRVGTSEKPIKFYEIMGG